MNRLLLLTLLMSAWLTASAQENFFSVTAGPGLTTFKGDDAGSSTFRIGYHVGFLSSASIMNSKLHFQSGGQFLTAGAVDENDSEVKSIVNYLGFPLQLKYYVISGLAVSAGGQMNIIVKGEERTADTEIDSQDDANVYDLGLRFGLDYDLNRLNFQVAYYKGLTDVSKSSSFNNVFYQIGVGYKLFKD